MEWEAEVSSEHRISSESEETIVSEEEAKEPACKRKQMDKGMRMHKTVKTENSGGFFGNFWETVGKKRCFCIVYLYRELMKGSGSVS